MSNEEFYYVSSGVYNFR